MLTEKLKAQFGTNVPIFTDEIIAIFPEYTRAYVFRLIRQAEQAGDLCCFSRGIYFIPKKTFFGISTICPETVVEKKYLKSNGSIYGIYAGLNLLNRFGLTNQVPNIPEIVTNRESTRKRTITIEGRQFILRKSRCKITAENYPAYTLLQLFHDMADSDLPNDFFKKQIADFAAMNKVTIEDLIAMSVCFPPVALKKMIRSNVIHGTV